MPLKASIKIRTELKQNNLDFKTNKKDQLKFAFLYYPKRKLDKKFFQEKFLLDFNTLMIFRNFKLY